MGQCRACLQEFPELSRGYCPPCNDALREMIDELDGRQRELDRESAESYAEYELREDSEDE